MKECGKMSESKPTGDDDVSSDGSSTLDLLESLTFMKVNSVRKSYGTGTDWLIFGYAVASRPCNILQYPPIQWLS